MKIQRYKRVKSKGFTLLEVVIAMVVMSILSGSVIGIIKIAQRDQQAAYQNQVYRDNLEIANAFRSWSANVNKGLLPNPYTNAATKDRLAPVKMTPLASEKDLITLLDYLAKGRISSRNYNSDGSTVEQAKVYQKLTGISYEQPINGIAGETITLKYDRGVIYQTTCPKSDACNKNFVGASPAYALTGWASVFPDIKPIEFSTLDIQQSLWSNTWERMKEIRFKIRQAYTQALLAASAGDTSNHFFVPSSGDSDVGQLQCAVGWYSLKTSTVLDHYGLGPKSIYGVSAWDGEIDYCPDYDPLGEGPDVAPHHAAIRIKKDVTLGNPPDNSANNTFVLII